MNRNRNRLTIGIAIGAMGFIGIIGSLVIGAWARAHSPHMGFGEMLTKAVQNPDYMILNEPFYNLLIAVVVIGGLLGLVALVIGVLLAVISITARNTPA